MSVFKMRRLNLGFALTILFYLFPSLALSHGISDADKQRMLEGGYLQYVGLGATHMLTGYDHLLFLFGVIFFLATFKDIAKFVTVFTLGHCITLVFATFYQITWNYYLVDAIIALSVIYKGFDNNGGFQKYLDLKSPNLLGVVFSFGLLHGFGLSTRLQQLPLGDDKAQMLIRILSFNLGVELGQILALVFMVWALSFWRRHASFKRFSFAANKLLIYAGVYLLFMQMHGYFHDSHPNDFRFPAQEHKHAHEDMAIEETKKESGYDNL
jgi:HupE / UreJ protein